MHLAWPPFVLWLLRLNILNGCILKWHRSFSSTFPFPSPAFLLTAASGRLNADLLPWDTGGLSPAFFH